VDEGARQVIKTASEWTVLDNLHHHWYYTTSLMRANADEAYSRLTELGYIKDGLITPEGEAALLIATPNTRSLENR
jgi:hypothetical protein